jgi:hypothetical protein
MQSSLLAEQIAREILQRAGMGSLIVVSLVVGVRMLRLAARTRRLPELAIGAHILVLVLGYALEFAGLEGTGVVAGGSVLLRGAGNLCYAVAIFAYLLFTWRVFRPSSAGAAVVAGVCSLALAVGWIGEAWTGSFDFSPERFAAPWFWLAFVPRLVGMSWAAGEAFHHYVLLRRRLPLGLSEPAVVNRFLLWGLAALSECLIYGVVGAVILRGTPAAFLVGAPALLISALGLAAAVTILLAFLPPARYCRWVEERGGYRTE